MNLIVLSGPDWQNTVHLRAPSQAAMEAALIECGYAVAHEAVYDTPHDEETGEPLEPVLVEPARVEVRDSGPTYSLDIIGTIYTEGEFDGDEVIVAPEPIDGYHANLRLVVGASVPDALKSFVVEVNSPVRVFA